MSSLHHDHLLAEGSEPVQGTGSTLTTARGASRKPAGEKATNQVPTQRQGKSQRTGSAPTNDGAAPTSRSRRTAGGKAAAAAAGTIAARARAAGAATGKVATTKAATAKAATARAVTGAKAAAAAKAVARGGARGAQTGTASTAAKPAPTAVSTRSAAAESAAVKATATKPAAATAPAGKPAAAKPVAATATGNTASKATARTAVAKPAAAAEATTTEATTTEAATVKITTNKPAAKAPATKAPAAKTTAAKTTTAKPATKAPAAKAATPAKRTVAKTAAVQAPAKNAAAEPAAAKSVAATPTVIEPVAARPTPFKRPPTAVELPVEPAAETAVVGATDVAASAEGLRSRLRRRPPSLRRRPALYLAAALIGAVSVSGFSTGEPTAQATSNVSHSVSVAEALGIEAAPAEEITAMDATQRLGELAVSRNVREAQQQAAVQVQVAADQAAAAAAAEAARPKAVLPVNGARLTSGFGARWGTLHAGIDLAAPMQTPEYAAMDGVVLEAGPASGFGLAVYIQHENGDVTVYGHMDSILVQAGQVVRAGDTIALLGNRGQSTGPHLHFEVHVGGLNGQKVDPLPWLRERGVAI
jgi:murein DD-endopeptidase MepM/ murein hydrolase activator NlpD